MFVCLFDCLIVRLPGGVLACLFVRLCWLVSFAWCCVVVLCLFVCVCCLFVSLLVVSACWCFCSFARFISGFRCVGLLACLFVVCMAG